MSGYFHENFGPQLCQISNKGLNCLALMAQIGQVGSFDLPRAFTQKNFLKVLLQAKVLDKEFKIDVDVWRPSQLTGSQLQVMAADKIGKLEHVRSLTTFSNLLHCVANPKKDKQRQFEFSLKRQLYKQFLQNFKRGEQLDFIDYI